MGNFKKILVGLLLLASFGVRGQQSMFFGLNKQSFMAWDVSGLEYSESKNISAQPEVSASITIGNSNGSLYVLGSRGGKDSLYQYDFGTIGDLSTLTFSNKRLYVGTYSTGASGVDFSTDGTYLYVAYDYYTRMIVTYTLSTAWDISTATYTRTNKSFSLEPSLQGVCLASNGNYLYSIGKADQLMMSYSLNSAWNTGSWTLITFKDLSPQFTAPFDLDIKSDGYKFYVIGAFNSGAEYKVCEYTTTVAFEFYDSYTILSNSKIIPASYSPRGCVWSSDGLDFYVIGFYSTIYHYKIY